ncbi:hypothetical protein [uncultured Amphritea sp.]|uniref:hypothetical protein n=1 Tax=uncultured Amphritea sp. TaxID=981605 RepID=UPI002628F9F4|nr:hypothetical protein [uncultured Amphritea sp.]
MSVRISDHPACDSKKLFIEVTGINHTTDQTFQFYDLSDNTQQEYIEAKQAIEQVDDTTIFSWDWTPETENRNVWLSISGDSGPIKLPLFPDVADVPRQLKNQHYQLQAILPMTLLPSFNHLDDTQRLAPIRNGYIYLIYNNKIWREIAINRPSVEQMEFRDINLYAHRVGRDKPFNKGPREASGTPLKDIWLPLKANNRTVHLRAAYSEVQWSAAYLNFLEQKENWPLLAQRSHTVNPNQIENLYQQFQHGFIPPMRLREPELETQLAEPANHNRDISGNYRGNLYSQMQQEIASMRYSAQSAADAIKFDTPLRMEYGVRSAALNQQVNGINDEQKYWQPINGSDYLSEARERKLRLLQLPDPLFDLRHHTQMAMQVSACLFHILEDAGQQKYFQSAELVQRFVVPDKLPNGQENPNHKHLDSFDFSPISVFQRTLRTIERQRCHADMALFQEALGQTLDNPATAAAVRDITSQERGAPGAYRLVGNAFQALSLNLTAIDPLQDNGQPQDWPGRSTIANFYTRGASHPLHALLYPPADQVPLDTAYTAPSPVNDGSGLANTSNIAGWAGDTLLLNDQIENLEQALLLAENSEDGFSGSRRLLNTADGVLSGFFTAMLALQNKASARASLSELVETIEFKSAYLDNIRLGKLIAPDSFGQATFIPTSGESIAGAYVVGVHSKKAGLHFGLTEGLRKQTTGQRTGVLQDSNGKLLASTNKRSLQGTELRQGATARSKADLKALVIPDDNPVTQMKVEQLAKEADLADKLKPQSKAGGIAGQAYTRLGVPYFIVVLEIVNLQRAVAGFEGKSTSYILTSGASAFWDLGVAIVNASNFLSRETGRVATYTTKTIIKLPASAVRLLSAPSLGLHLERSLSRLKIAGVVGGALTTAVAIWDTCLLISAQDKDAAAAMAMVALGTGLSTFGSLYTATFLMSPLGWIGLAIALVGFGLYMLFKDSPMETWLKNGPFGASPDRTGDYKYLQKPDKAWQHFINLIMNLRIKTYLIQQIELPTKLRLHLENLGATHGVWVTSNMFGLSNPDQQALRFHARQAVLKSTVKVTRIGRQRPTFSVEQLSRSDAPVIYQHKLDNGYIFFYRYDKTVPRPDSEYKLLEGSSYLYNYDPHFHTRAQLQIGEHTFPTPPLNKEEEAGSPPRTPTFTKGEYWWANEFGWEQ